MKLCSKCNSRERISSSYCRICKNENDLKSYHKNQEKRRKYQKQYFDNNPEKKNKQKQQTKQWFQDNPSYMNGWMKNKYKTDTSHKIKAVIQASLSNALMDKSKPSLWYIGCNIEELKHHLESQFTPNMNWDNHGQYGWHIDHIKPVNTFDLTDEKQLKECWNYTNLRPLWWDENLRRPKNGLDIK